MVVIWAEVRGAMVMVVVEVWGVCGCERRGSGERDDVDDL